MPSRGVRILVNGKVQGVWYRGSTQAHAIALGLKGWVRNEEDGSVTVHAFGESDAMDRFIRHCSIGPKHAVVDQFVCEEIPYEEHSSFEIRRKR